MLEEQFDAQVLLRGTICNYSLKMEGGYDIGSLDIRNGSDSVTYTFWNENMFVSRGEERIATFPDLICMLDAATGESISTAEARDGRDVFGIVIPKNHLILGAGKEARDREDLVRQARRRTEEDPSLFVWIVLDGPRAASSVDGRVRVSYTGGEGSQRADRFVVDYVRMAKLLGLAAKVSVRTNDRDFQRQVGRALGSETVQGGLL